MSAVEFQGWPKIARLNRDIVISEKIDGTNAAILIVDASGDQGYVPENRVAAILRYGTPFDVYAQSRTRFITPEQDNHGFAAWVHANADTLVADLGPGRHFGEWWGSGINRGYGLPKGEKRFSLFNTSKWAEVEFTTPFLETVPVLYIGEFHTSAISNEITFLSAMGSVASPGFMKPEGVVVYHTAANTCFKITIEGDEKPKGQA